MSKNQFPTPMWLFVGTIAIAIAQTTAFAQSSTSGSHDTLKLVVILSRHGVRSPTWTQERLDSFSAQPWPKFTVEPGFLTPRGYTLIERFSAWDRQAYAAKGLFPATGCDAAASTYIWADIDQRTVATGHAFAEGLFPGCAPQVYSLDSASNDPVFHPAAGAVTPAQADQAFTELSQRLSTYPDQRPLIAELQSILMGCAPAAPCHPANPPATLLPDTPTAVLHGKGDHIVDLQGPLPTASTLSEDLLLEFGDNLPATSVGWGHADQGEIHKLLALHTAYFDLIHRTPAIAKVESGALLNHIARTLEQSVQGKPVEGAIGPVGERLVILAGHDTNLAGVAALLGTHWTLDGRTDDTPPGTQLAFELWQAPTGSYTVRITAAQQTLPQLRDASPLTLTTPPATETLTLPACTTSPCTWSDFAGLASTPKP